MIKKVATETKIVVSERDGVFCDECGREITKLNTTHLTGEKTMIESSPEWTSKELKRIDFCGGECFSKYISTKPYFFYADLIKLTISNKKLLDYEKEEN